MNTGVVGHATRDLPILRQEAYDHSRSQTSHGQGRTPNVALPRIAFPQCKDVGTLNTNAFAAQWLAYPHPCQRFAPYLTVRRAWLGDSMVCYTFTVRDLHPLLLAGLPAHCASIPQRDNRPNTTVIRPDVSGYLQDMAMQY